MAQSGERHFTFRLYEDNTADMDLLGKLDRLLADGKFRSKNEVLRKGIARVYETCYGATRGKQVSAGFADHEIREASRMIADEIISRVGGSISGGFGSCSLPKEAEKMTDETTSFLSGLNSGG